LPLLTLSYKYFLPWHYSSTLSFYTFQTYLPGGGIIGELKNSSEDLPQQFFEPLIPSSLQEEMAINFVVPEVNSAPAFFFFCIFDFLYSYLLSVFSLSFLYFSNIQTFRN